MKAYCDLTFKDDLHGDIIRKLIGELGYKYHKRTIGTQLVYRKWYMKLNETHEDVKETVANNLNKSCNNITEAFWSSTELDKTGARTALIEFSEKQQNPMHKVWVLEWIRRNVDDTVGDDVTPWG